MVQISCLCRQNWPITTAPAKGHTHDSNTPHAGCFYTFETLPENQQKLVHLILQKKNLGWDNWPHPFYQEYDIPPPDEPDPDVPRAEMTHFTFMDLSIDGEPAGRLIFGLYGNELKRTVENFRALCAGDRVSVAYILTC